MAILFVDSLTQKNNRVVQILVKILELLLLSTGLITTLVMVKRAVILPYSCQFVFSSLVGFWSSVTCFLSSPLSICIIIHVMVVMIAASSAFCRHETDDGVSVSTVDQHVMQIAASLIVSPQPPAAPPPSPPETCAEETLTLEAPEIKKPAESPEPIKEKTLARDHPPLSDKWKDIHVEDKDEEEDTMDATWKAITGGGKKRADKKSLKKSEWDARPPSPPATCAEEIKKPEESAEPIKEKKLTTDHPPLSDKLKEIYVEEEEEDTMDATWMAITGGGKKRADKKSLKKSETWDAPPRCSAAVQRVDSEEIVPSSPKWKELRKTETFNDAVSITRRGGLIRRDPSMSLEEFNKQVEAFIKKFNDNMRLQRQESKKRFLDMINKDPS